MTVYETHITLAALVKTDEAVTVLPISARRRNRVRYEDMIGSAVEHTPHSAAPALLAN